MVALTPEGADGDPAERHPSRPAGRHRQLPTVGDRKGLYSGREIKSDISAVVTELFRRELLAIAEQVAGLSPTAIVDGLARLVETAAPDSPSEVLGVAPPRLCSHLARSRDRLALHLREVSTGGRR